MFRPVLFVLMVSTAALAFKTGREIEFESENLPLHDIPLDKEESDYGDMEDEMMPHNLTGPVDESYVDVDNGRTTFTACPKGFLGRGGVCFHLGTNYVSWYDALIICKFVAKGAHLAEIRSPQRQRFLRTLINSKKARGEYWLGGTNLIGRKYRWNHSSAVVAKRYWDINEPNNTNYSEHCTELRHNGRLNANDCQARRLYICVKKA